MRSRTWYITVIALTLLCIWLWYIGQGPHYKELQPGTKEYEYYHASDTIDESRIDVIYLDSLRYLIKPDSPVEYDSTWRTKMRNHLARIDTLKK